MRLSDTVESVVSVSMEHPSRETALESQPGAVVPAGKSTNTWAENGSVRPGAEPLARAAYVGVGGGGGGGGGGEGFGGALMVKSIDMVKRSDRTGITWIWADLGTPFEMLRFTVSGAGR